LNLHNGLIGLEAEFKWNEKTEAKSNAEAQHGGAWQSRNQKRQNHGRTEWENGNAILL